VFLLVHKMDLVRANKPVLFDKKKAELQVASGDFPVMVFGTSIYDESLYKVVFILYPLKTSVDS
jgi:Ras-related GTP-binding protein A/B